MPRNGQFEVEATILGGLPVLVRGTILPPEPDVGIFSPQVDINSIHWPKRPWNKIPPSVEARQRSADPGDEQLIEQILEAVE